VLQKVQVGLLAVIAAAVLALLARPPDPVVVSGNRPCVVVVNPTQKTIDGRKVYQPETIGNGC
jgi:hypothetical protein